MQQKGKKKVYEGTVAAVAAAAVELSAAPYDGEHTFFRQVELNTPAAAAAAD